jgi:hypothetical protein
MDSFLLNIPFLAASYCLQASSAPRYPLPLLIGSTAKLRTWFLKIYIPVLSTAFNKLYNSLTATHCCLFLVVTLNGRLCELISKMFLQSADCKCIYIWWFAVLCQGFRDKETRITSSDLTDDLLITWCSAGGFIRYLRYSENGEPQAKS